MSGLRAERCLEGVHVLYLASTILVAGMVGFAAVLDFAGAESVKTVADRLQIPRRLMVPFGVVLASAAVGLLLGIAVPALGTAAAAGLVAYFVCALSAHARAHDRHVGGAVFFLLASLVVLAANLGFRHHG